MGRTFKDNMSLRDKYKKWRQNRRARKEKEQYIREGNDRLLRMISISGKIR